MADLPLLRRFRKADLLATVVVWGCAALVVGLFVWILADVLFRGAGGLSWEFLTTAPRRSGRAGGILPVIVSTLLILAVCLAASVPLGIGAAMFLAECAPAGSRLGRFVRRSLDVLAGVPSVVFGLFGNAFFCVTLGLGFSILSGGLTLACMVLPLLIRATEEGFRSVPDDFRLAAAALGMSRTTTLFRLLLPAAWPGVLVGLVLGIGRALAETAALIFTSGYVTRMPESLSDSGRALSVHIYDLAMNVPGGERPAAATAVVLIALLAAINLVAAASRRWFTHQNVSVS